MRILDMDELGRIWHCVSFKSPARVSAVVRVEEWESLMDVVVVLFWLTFRLTDNCT